MSESRPPEFLRKTGVSHRPTFDKMMSAAKMPKPGVFQRLEWLDWYYRAGVWQGYAGWVGWRYGWAILDSM